MGSVSVNMPQTLVEMSEQCVKSLLSLASSSGNILNLKKLLLWKVSLQKFNGFVVILKILCLAVFLVLFKWP